MKSHDGFRVIARKDGARVRLYSRPSYPKPSCLISCSARYGKSRPSFGNGTLKMRRDATRVNRSCSDLEMGLEGIVSKRLGSRYRSGRSHDWLKFKNPQAPAVKREAEEYWASHLGCSAFASARP
jgi:hypothetical protein